MCRLTVGLTGATLGEFGLVLFSCVCSAQARSFYFSSCCSPSHALLCSAPKPLLSYTDSDHSQLNSPPLFDASNLLETSHDTPEITCCELFFSYCCSSRKLLRSAGLPCSDCESRERLSECLTHGACGIPDNCCISLSADKNLKNPRKKSCISR